MSEADLGYKLCEDIESLIKDLRRKYPGVEIVEYICDKMEQHTSRFNSCADDYE